MSAHAAHRCVSQCRTQWQQDAPKELLQAPQTRQAVKRSRWDSVDGVLVKESAHPVQLCVTLWHSHCETPRTPHTPLRHTYSPCKLVKPSNAPAVMLVMALLSTYLPTQHIHCVRQSHNCNTLCTRQQRACHCVHTHRFSKLVKPPNAPVRMLVMLFSPRYLHTQHIPRVRQSHAHCGTPHTP